MIDVKKHVKRIVVCHVDDRNVSLNVENHEGALYVNDVDVLDLNLVDVLDHALDLEGVEDKRCN
jgi:hypothetical protein